MVVEKVPFKVYLLKEGCAMGYGALKKMGLIQVDAVAPSSTPTLRPEPSRAHFVSVKSMMMVLLHTLVCKVSHGLKNQKTLSSNQRKLAVGHNADHPKHEIKLGFISCSNNDVEPEEEEAFDVLAPQF